MANENQIKVAARDFVSLGEKLERLHSTLPAGEANVFELLIENAVAGAGQWPPPPWFTPKFKYKPRGAKHLVASGGAGAEGFTILITGRGKVIVWKPEGPLPTERGVLGAIPIRGE